MTDTLVYLPIEVRSLKGPLSPAEESVFLRIIQQLPFDSIFSSISSKPILHERRASSNSLRYGVLVSTFCSTPEELTEKLGGIGWRPPPGVSVLISDSATTLRMYS